MKQRSLLILMLIAPVTTQGNNAIPALIPSTIPVYAPTPNSYYIGYDDNCDMATNGEQYIANTFIKSYYTVFDVGANKGEWSNYILSIRPNIFLYVFEPIPSIFETLKNSFLSKNISLFNLAISNENTIKDFFNYSGNSRSELSSLHRRSEQIEAILRITPTKISVPTKRLDTICKEERIARIDFLKIDTEGAELEVLCGATNLLENKAISIIQFEYGGTYQDAHITLQEVYSLLTHYNYSIFRIVPNGLIYITHWDPRLENYKYSNYLAVLS